MPVTANPLDVVASKPNRDDEAKAVAGSRVAQPTA